MSAMLVALSDHALFYHLLHVEEKVEEEAITE